MSIQTFMARGLAAQKAVDKIIRKTERESKSPRRKHQTSNIEHPTSNIRRCRKCGCTDKIEQDGKILGNGQTEAQA